MKALTSMTLHSCSSFVRGISENFEITEELLSMESMKDITTGEDIYLLFLEMKEKDTEYPQLRKSEWLSDLAFAVDL